jgi:hypothetical protein
MDNNTVKKRDKNKDSSVLNEDSEEQTTKAAAVDTSADIIDIMDTPDVATWNKEIHIKGDAADIVKRYHWTKTPPITSDIGLKEKGSKDMIIDPADKKDVDKVVKSGATLTDEADLS